MERPLYIKSAVGGVGLKCHCGVKRASGCVSHLESKQHYQGDLLAALTLYHFTVLPSDSSLDFLQIPNSHDSVHHSCNNLDIFSDVDSLLPLFVQVYDRLLITSWGHDPGVVPTSNVLMMLNDALTHSAVLIQVNTHAERHTLSFSVAAHVCFGFLVWLNQLQGVLFVYSSGSRHAWSWRNGAHRFPLR